MSESDQELTFVIDGPPLSMGRIGEYMTQLEIMLGVPVRLIRVEQTDDAERLEPESEAARDAKGK